MDCRFVPLCNCQRVFDFFLVKSKRCDGIYDVGFLDDFETPECRLPCFQGITPSITTFEQAAEIAGFAGDTLTIPVMMDF
jgi:hypothetical protein